MFWQKKVVLISLLILFTAVSVIGFFNWKSQKKVSRGTADCALGWQEVDKSKFGFKLKYPTGWTVDQSPKIEETDSLTELNIISTTHPEEQMDPRYRISRFSIMASKTDLKTDENYQRYFDNGSGNRKKSSVDFKGIITEKYVDETEMICSGQADREPKNCPHRFEMYYFKKGSFYYLLSIGIYTPADLKEKNEATLACFLNSFQLTEAASGLKKCTLAIWNPKVGCDNKQKQPVCGQTRMVFDNGQERVDRRTFDNPCFYCSQFDPVTGFGELRGTTFYQLGYSEGECK